jgi:small subunit ribosomal protein MRP21
VGVAQKRHQSAWTTPSRPGRGGYNNDSNITKPDNTLRPWRSAAKPEIPNPDSKKPAPAADSEDMVRDITFGLGDLSSNKLYTDETTHVAPKYPEIRCVPRTGRTVQVTRDSGGAARAFKVLGMQCAANRVRQDARQQRFHERPGLKRKRLKSERWRRRFKQAFRATCKRVDELRRQGW